MTNKLWLHKNMYKEQGKVELIVLYSHKKSNTDNAEPKVDLSKVFQL